VPTRSVRGSASSLERVRTLGATASTRSSLLPKATPSYTPAPRRSSTPGRAQADVVDTGRDEDAPRLDQGPTRQLDREEPGRPRLTAGELRAVRARLWSHRDRATSSPRRRPVPFLHFPVPTRFDEQSPRGGQIVSRVSGEDVNDVPGTPALRS
jgi:hypothetical protein